MRSAFKFAGGEFRPNFKLNRDLRKQHTLDDVLGRLAGLAALGAREIAVRVAYDRGDYYGSIRGGLGLSRRGLTVGRVSAGDFKANWIENRYRLVTRSGRVVGTVKGRNVLRRGARRAGLRVRPAKRGPVL